MASTSTFAIHHPRLSAYQHLMVALEQLGSPMAGSSVWIDFLNRLPLTLGESAAERSVTYSLSDQTHDAIYKAVESILDLIKRRYDPHYDHEKKTSLLPDERLRVSLWPRRFCPRTIPHDSPLRNVVKISLQGSPDLDAGLMESWLSRSAGGKRFFDLLFVLSDKYINAGLAQVALSGVILMSHLALLNSILDAKASLKQTSLKNIGYVNLDRAVGMALHGCFQSAVLETFIHHTIPPAHTPEYRDRMVLMACLSPLLFLSIRKNDLGHDVNPFGLTEPIQDMLWPIYQPVLEHGNQPLYVLRECLRIVCGQQVLIDTLLPVATCEIFRRLILDHLIHAEDPGSNVDQLLARAFYKNIDLVGLLEDPSSVGQLAAELAGRINRPDGEEPETKQLYMFLDRIRVAGLHRSKKKLTSDDLSILQDLLERFILYRMDEYASANIQQSLKRIVDRRKETPTSALIQEYQAGRLYRIADDDHPLVKGRVVFEEAQLFVDLKGYTRRTACAKELVMAEFLKNEFYRPIIEAAKKYYVGLAWNPSDSIQLVNLLGDAVAFSGNIVSLVDLAYDIQKIFRSYSQKLQELSPMEEESAFLSLTRKVETRRVLILNELDNHHKTLRSLEAEINRRRNLPVAEMAKLLQADYQTQMQELQNEYLTLQKNPPDQTSFDAQSCLNDIKCKYENLKSHRKQTLEQLQASNNQERSRLLGDLICRKLLGQLRDLENQIQLLEEEDRTLCNSLEEERHLQKGAGLEAGLFISYGAAAEVIQFDDDLWGDQRVSVCERLNEAARGTARNNLVKRNMDDILAATRIEKANSKLELPFRVYISQTRPFDLEPALNRFWNRVISEKKPQVLQRFISQLQEKLIRQIEQPENTQNRMQAYTLNDIYNLGEAISEKALDAYLNATRSTHFFFFVSADVSTFHPEIQKRFLFLDTHLHLIVGTRLNSDVDKIELFRYEGQILFRGFEVMEPTKVFEIMRPNSAFVRLLQKHHLSKWLTEAHQDPTRKIHGLEPLDIGSACVP